VIAETSNCSISPTSKQSTVGQLFSASRSSSPSRFRAAVDAQRQNLGQAGEFGARRCPLPAEAECAVERFHIYIIEEQHVEVDIQVQGAAEALVQGGSARLGRLTVKIGLSGQVCGDAELADAEHPAHDGWMSVAQFKTLVPRAIHSPFRSQPTGPTRHAACAIAALASPARCWQPVLGG
jgi:hypothetical protein